MQEEVDCDYLGLAFETFPNQTEELKLARSEALEGVGALSGS